jgi:hypothetical protein
MCLLKMKREAFGDNNKNNFHFVIKIFEHCSIMDRIQTKIVKLQLTCLKLFKSLKMHEKMRKM